MKIKVIVHEAEEGGYWAEVPALAGCATQGETFEELLQNLYEAIEGCLAVANLSLRQVDVADDTVLNLGDQPLIRPIGRVAQCPEERVAIGSVEDVQKGLVDRLMIGLGTESELDRTAPEG